MEGKEEMFYCPICGLPPDFCQYGPSWEKCKPYVMEHFPQWRVKKKCFIAQFVVSRQTFVN